MKGDRKGQFSIRISDIRFVWLQGHLRCRDRGLPLGEFDGEKNKTSASGGFLREEFMLPLKLSMNRMAMDLRVTETDRRHHPRAARHYGGHALRFARYFQNPPVFWMNLQIRYDLEVAEDEIAVKVARDVRPLEVSTN